MNQHMPKEPEAFAAIVEAEIRKQHPEMSLERRSASEFIVDGRRMCIDNVRRLAESRKDEWLDCIQQYVAGVFDSEYKAVNTMNWEQAAPKIMPRIQHDCIFSHISQELVAHVPWVNDCSVVFIIDLPKTTVSVTREQVLRWGVGIDTLEQAAIKNLVNFAPDFRTVEATGNTGGHSVIFTEQDSYDAARILLPDLYRQLAPKLGGDFFVGLPYRDLLVAFSRQPDDMVARVRQRMQHDHTRMPYPITPKLFYVTRDGIAGDPLNPS